jgi:hypothetical protein
MAIQNGETAMAYLVICAADGATIETHLDQSHAQYRAAHLQETTGRNHYAKKAPDLLWRERECDRFWNGTYQRVAWHNESWFTCAPLELKDHFAHRSSDKPELVAFTESAEKGEQDRQTRMRAGAYLQKYFSERLSATAIDKWAQIHSSQSEKLSPELVKIARTADEIKRVYLDGPESCMTLEAERFNCAPYHPTAVYGDSDLAVAYVERSASFHSAEISARALIWPEAKVFARIYPTAERYSGLNRELAIREVLALTQALEAMGYQKGSFQGAKIKAIKIEDSEYVMPYLDGSYRVELSSDETHFTLCRNRDGVDAQNTNGTIDLRDGITCERCESNTNEDYAQTVYTARHDVETWCESCANNHGFYCHGDESIYSDHVESVEVNGETYAIYYARRNFQQCARTDDWIDPDDGHVVHVKDGAETWCEDALGDAFVCALSEDYYSSDDFQYVIIDGHTYERSAALEDETLSAKLVEMENEGAE